MVEPVGITKVILQTMKTAISLPDEIFEEAERLARRAWYVAQRAVRQSRR